LQVCIKYMNKIIIANWKMRLGIKESVKLAEQYAQRFKDAARSADLASRKVVICPSEISLTKVREAVKDSPVKLGAQNVFWEEIGSYTGEISIKTLEEAGCEYVIIGHSERRQYLLENYEMIHNKTKETLDHSKITPIVCVGESIEDRESEKRENIIISQVQQAFSGIQLLPNQQAIVAYEPIWAIGTGQVIRPDDVENMHEMIRAAVVDMFGVDVVKSQIRIIYGGSVDGKNVKKLASLDNIDGFLVGGASLKINEFAKIAESL